MVCIFSYSIREMYEKSNNSGVVALLLPVKNNVRASDKKKFIKFSSPVLELRYDTG
jgi:hypothetical protein